MKEILEIQKPSKAVPPDNDDVWELSRQGSTVPPKAEPVFHYSRKHRIEHSSRTVRKLHDPDSDSKWGRGFHLLGGLTHQSSQKRVFVSIAMFFVIISLIFVLTDRIGTKRLGGNVITAEARRFDDMTLITINKTFKEENVGSVYSGTVDVMVGPFSRPQPSIRRNPFAEKEVVIDEDHPVVTERLEFFLEPEEVYELFLPYEAPDFLLVMQINDEEPITLRLRAKRPFSLFGIEL
jgi:hypothetical protein